MFLERIFGFKKNSTWNQIAWYAKVSNETNDSANIFKVLAITDHPWASKFSKYAKEAFEIDFSGLPPPSPPPTNDNIFNWNENKDEI